MSSRRAKPKQQGTSGDRPQQSTSTGPERLDEGHRLRVVPTANEALIERIKGEDRAALSQLFDGYSRKIYAIGSKLLREPQAADQLVQDVLLLVWRHAQFFDRSKESAEDWVLRIVYWCCFARRRHPRLSTEAIHAEFAKKFTRIPSGRAEQSFAGLPEIQRRVLTLYFFEGKTLNEVSQSLNQPIKDIRTQYYQGLVAMTGREKPAEILSTADELSVLEQDTTPDPVGS